MWIRFRLKAVFGFLEYMVTFFETFFLKKLTKKRGKDAVTYLLARVQ
jgi:hypothetical protein